jgi:hypothetical protein
MKKSLLYISIFAVLVLLLSGCLGTEYKEYHFIVNEDGSGSGSINHINLVSGQEEGVDVSDNDFADLVNNHLFGTSFEDENPNLTVTGKELLEVDGQLCGYVEFTFDNYMDIGFQLINYDTGSLVAYFFDDITEEVLEANGEFDEDEDALPIIEWATDTRQFDFKALAKKDMTNAKSLLGHYQNWISADE